METFIRTFVVATVILFIARTLAVISQFSTFNVAAFMNASRIIVKTLVFAFLDAAVFTILKSVHVVLETRFEIGVTIAVVTGIIAVAISFSIVKFVNATIETRVFESVCSIVDACCVVDDTATAKTTQEIISVDQGTIVIANSRLSIAVINNFVGAPVLLAACSGWTQDGLGKGGSQSQKNERGD